MGDVQDDDQWLYGDDEENSELQKNEDVQQPVKDTATESDSVGPNEPSSDAPTKNKEADSSTVPTDGETQESTTNEEAAEGEKSDGKGGDSSDDDDDFTITIGELKKAAEVMTPGQQHQARFQPKTAPSTGLKDEDFTSAGKVNGTPVAELTSSDRDDKPWRKPGADLSDYFNYGFNEETWFKYCDRQKAMRINESGSGLTSLGINASKPFGSSGTPYNPERRQFPPYGKKSDWNGRQESNSIQVMTGERRGTTPPQMMAPPHCDDMDFGGNGYMDPNSYYQPQHMYYGGPPPPTAVSAYSAAPTPWSNPPPAIVPPQMSQPPPGHPLHAVNISDPPPPGPQWGGDIPPPPVMGSTHPSSPPPTYREHNDSDDDRKRSRRHRRSSRSPSRSRYRSRSSSPAHKYKRKKSKRDRDD